MGLLFAASPAFAADDDRDFQEHYQRGVQLYKLNFLRQAVKEFVAAYAANPLPRLLYNIGQLQRKLGDYKDAAESYELYLRTETDVTPERRAEVQRYIDALRSSSGTAIAALPPAGDGRSPDVSSTSGAASSDAPALLMILPPTATGKAGRYMFNMRAGVQENLMITLGCEVKRIGDRAGESPLDGHLHAVMGTRWAHGAVLGVRTWDR